jgi:RHS repeat-associated protein
VLATASGSDTYSYLGSGETVLRIANSVTGTTDSIVSPAGDRLGVRAGSVVNWLLPDLHGSVAGALDADEATVVHAIRYDAWGQTLATGSAGGSAVGERAWTYQGRLDVSPAGLGTPLLDLSARFYAPGLGGFTQADTVAGSAQDPLSMNRFLYAQANPATLIDPTGHTAYNLDRAMGRDGVGIYHARQAYYAYRALRRTMETRANDRDFGRGRDRREQATKHVLSATARQARATQLRVAGGGEAAARNALKAQMAIAHPDDPFGELLGAGDAFLDVAGTIDPTGAVDLVHGATYAARGDLLNAGISAASIVPFGDAAKLTRTALRHGDEALDLAEGIAHSGDEVVDGFLRSGEERVGTDFAVTASGTAIPFAGGKPIVSDPNLQRYVNDLYKSTAVVGNGGTGDAIRWTTGTGELVGGSDHITKGLEYSNGLRKWLANPPTGATVQDIATARGLLDDLTDALSR